MSVKNSPLLSLVLAAGAAVVAAVAVTQLPGQKSTVSSPTAATVKVQWTASAPGRVEARYGDVRMSAVLAGRVAEVPVKVNDKVTAGDLLVRIDDEEARARIAAAEAEAQVRKRERDSEAATGRLATDRRQAEDNLATSERALTTARAEFDRVLRQRRADTAGVTDETVATERNNVSVAVEKVEQDRAALKRAQTAGNVPLPTRLEAGLAAARADLTLAELALERTRLRAPADGTVLQVTARVGETAAASPEQPLVVLGDLSAVRVRAEVDERDFSKVKKGQAVTLRTDALPGREFQGRVSTIAAALGTAKLVPRGPKRPNDLDTLEVLIDVTGDGLLPGMRVDVFFKPDEPAAQAPAAAPASAPARAAAAAPTQPAAKSATSSATPSTTVK